MSVLLSWRWIWPPTRDIFGHWPSLALLDGVRDGSDEAWLFLYGPYRRADVPTAPSNETFDASLRERNPDWGLRDLEVLAAAAGERGLALTSVVEMPSNNLSLRLEKG